MNLIEYIQGGITPYHVVAQSISYLESEGFTKLEMESKWNIEKGAGYYVSPYPSMLIAFRAGNENVRIATAHTDYPVLRLKPNPTMQKEENLVANVESYGGMILHTWFDRPLCLAGRVVCKSENVFQPNTLLYDSGVPVAVIPSLAIHMDREVNKKNELKCQVNLLPLCGLNCDTSLSKDAILEYIAKDLDVRQEDILDFDLYFYNPQKPEFVGLNQELFVSPRLDNLTSCFAAIYGLAENTSLNTCVTALFDHEEIGSRSKQGADSNLLAIFMDKLMRSMRDNGISDSLTKESLLKQGFVLSLDVAHAFHPNYADKSDPTTKTILGNGVVFKTSGSQRYHSDSYYMAMMMQLCQKYQIPYQRQINHSDIAGGSTLGPIVTRFLPIPGMDAGVGILGMHSTCETAAVKDCRLLCQFAGAFFAE